MKLTINQVFSLLAEIQGIESKKGLLSQSLSLKTKLKLKNFSKELESIITPIEDLKKEFIETHGEVSEKGKYLKVFEDGEEKIYTETFSKYLKQMEELGKTETQIIVPDFDIEEFDFKTEEYYPEFINLF